MNEYPVIHQHKTSLKFSSLVLIDLLFSPKTKWTMVDWCWETGVQYGCLSPNLVIKWGERQDGHSRGDGRGARVTAGSAADHRVTETDTPPGDQAASTDMPEVRMRFYAHVRIRHCLTDLRGQKKLYQAYSNSKQ